MTPEKIKEIMDAFRFVPDKEDAEAAYVAGRRFLELCAERDLDMGMIDVFQVAFNRGAYWMQQKLQQGGEREPRAPRKR